MRGLVAGYEEYKSKGGNQGVLSGTSNVSIRSPTCCHSSKLTCIKVYLALKYGLQPVGTIAHEWIMAVGATYGYKGANGRAMDMWEEGREFSYAFIETYPLTQGTVYPPDTKFASPLTMLTDTYTAAVFFKDFISDPARALRWSVLRQDSGNAFKFVEDAKKAWRTIEDKAGIKRDVGRNGEETIAKGKKVIFSDALDVEKAIKLQQGCDTIGMAGEFMG